MFWVTRAKDNMAYDVVKKMPRSKDEKILRDEIIQLSDPDNEPCLALRGLTSGFFSRSVRETPAEHQFS